VADEGAKELRWEVLIEEQGIPVLFVEVEAWYDGRVSSSEILRSVGIALEREPRLAPMLAKTRSTTLYTIHPSPKGILSLL